MWCGGQREEGPVFPQEKLFGLGKFIVLAAQGISGKAGAVGFIVGKRRDVVDAVGQCRRPFVRGVIADQISPTSGNGLSPVAGVLIELRFFGRVNLIADNSGEHDGVLLIIPPDSLLRCVNASPTVEV